MAMKTIRKVVRYVLLAMIVLAAGCQAMVDSRRTETRTTEVCAPLVGITQLEIATDIGSITVESADVDECKIIAHVSAQAGTVRKARERAESIPVCITSIGGVLDVKVLSPSTFGVNPFQIDLTVTAPPNMALGCLTEVGDIRITGFDREVRARANVGDIVCTGLRAAVRLHADIGDIRAVYGDDAPPALNAEMMTGVGTIALDGPARISAMLTAVVRKGAIRIDRRLGIADPIGKSVTAPVGDAEGRIELRVTQRGSVEIL